MSEILSADSQEAAFAKRRLMQSVKTLVLRALPAYKTVDDSQVSVIAAQSHLAARCRGSESKRRSEPVFSTSVRDHFSARSPQPIDLYLSAMSATRPVVCAGEKRAVERVAVKSTVDKIKQLARAVHHPFPLPSDCPSDVDLCDLTPTTTVTATVVQHTISRTSVRGQPTRTLTLYQRSSDGALLIRVDSDIPSSAQQVIRPKRAAYHTSRLTA